MFIFTLSAQSKGKMVLQSLLLPGLGQIQSGHSHGYYMLAAEVSILASLFYFDKESDLKFKEAYEYALKYANVNPGSYSDEYFSHLSRYNSSGYEAGGYNSLVLDKAMQLYPNQPDLQQQYLAANVYSDEMAWKWENASNRRAYGNIRGDMNSYKDYAKIMTGVLILNHLVSVVDVLRLDSESKRASFHVGIEKKSPTLFVNLSF